MVAGMTLGMVVIIITAHMKVVFMRVVFIVTIFASVHIHDVRQLGMRQSVRCRDRQSKHRKRDTKQSNPEMAHISSIEDRPKQVKVLPCVRPVCAACDRWP